MAPDVKKELALDFAGRLLDTLKLRNLLFDGWQEQRDVRRKVMAEIRLMLLSEFREHRTKIDELTDAVYQALEGQL